MLRGVQRLLQVHPLSVRDRQIMNLQRLLLAVHLETQELLARSDLAPDRRAPKEGIVPVAAQNRDQWKAVIEPSKVEKRLQEVKDKLDRAKIPATAREDMLADYWKAFGQLREALDDLDQADKFYRNALAFKRGWAPATNCLKRVLEKKDSKSRDAAKDSSSSPENRAPL